MEAANEAAWLALPASMKKRAVARRAAYGAYVEAILAGETRKAAAQKARARFFVETGKLCARCFFFRLEAALSGVGGAERSPLIAFADNLNLWRDLWKHDAK